MASAGKVFISYRREDSADVCARIYDWLTYRLPPGYVFKDVDAIPFGTDFMQYVGALIKQCSVVLLVIGTNWLTPGTGLSPYIRMEIELALQYKVKIIPILVHEATMPSAQALPPSVESIVSLNANTVHFLDPYFHTDMERLASELGIGKRAPVRGGTYWGITRPRYLALSLFALATCVSAVIFTALFVALDTSGSDHLDVDFIRWLGLAAVLVFACGFPSLLLFLVRAIGSKNWQWLGGLALSIVPGAIAGVIDKVESTHANVTAVAVYPLLLGIPSFLILSFAVFGPTNRARQSVLWALLVVVVLSGCWIIWYAF